MSNHLPDDLKVLHAVSLPKSPTQQLPVAPWPRSMVLRYPAVVFHKPAAEPPQALRRYVWRPEIAAVEQLAAEQPH